MRVRLFLLFLILASSWLYGQGNTVTLTVSKTSVWVGESYGWTATSGCTVAVAVLTVSFGDGTVLTQSGNYFSGTHAYTSNGTFTMVAADTVCGGTASVAMTVKACPVITYLTTSLPNAMQGVFYSASINVQGGAPPLTWAVTSGSLPPGITLGSSDGLLSGTPTTAGTFSFRVRVQDSCPSIQRLSQDMTLIVQPSCPPLSLLTTSLPSGQQGTAYSAPLQASGGMTPYLWSVTGGSLPPGLSLDGSTGLISGTPTQAGTFSFTGQVQDSCPTPQRASLPYTVVIQAGCPPLTIMTSSIPPALLGSAYQAALTSSGGVPPTQWALVSGRLPQGMSFSTSGILSGTPTESGQFVLGIQVRDACTLPGPQTATATLTLLVAAPEVSITAAPSGFAVSPEAAAQVPVAYTFLESHGFNFALASGGYDILLRDAVLQHVNQPLQVQVTQGRGSASETLLIPAALIQELQRRGEQALSVRRSFSLNPYEWSVRLEGVLAGTAAAPFGVRRVMIFFEGNLGQVIVPLHREKMTAFATVWYTGSGLLNGDWRVDDRILSTFSIPVFFGDSVTLTSPVLPTFEPGSHLVRLTLSAPRVTFEIPEISYAVQPFAQSIRLVAPAEGSGVSTGDFMFTWEVSGDVPTYRLVISMGEAQEPLFKALTRKPSFRLSGEVTQEWPLDTLLHWKVIGEDGNGGRIMESPWGSFRFKPMEKDTAQVVAVVPESERGRWTAWLEANDATLLQEEPLPTLQGVLILLQAGSEEKALQAEVLLKKQPWAQAVSKNRLFLSQQKSPPSYEHYLYSFDEFHMADIQKKWTGKNVRLAVIDSGIEAEHPDLRANVLETLDFVGEATAAGIHGTAVAGLISGNNGGGRGYRGMAPEAGLLSLRACQEPDRESALAMCRTWSLARALDTAVQKDAQVINLSVGGENDPLLTQLLQAALKRDILIVAAAGNNGPDGAVMFPGSMPGVISVGSVGGEGTAAASSARGKVDIAAFGEDIFAPVPGHKYNFLSGTSMAAAHVSGIAALAKQIKPDITPAEFAEVLRATALRKGDAKVYGAGLIQPCAIVKTLSGEEVCGAR